MTLTGVEPVKDPLVTIQARPHGGGGAVVELNGVLSHRDPGPLLRPFFEALHAAMVKQERSSLTIDLRALRFMNSASFKHFVTWIKTNDALPPAQRYGIKFILSNKHHWQEVSSHALQCFSMEAITVEKEGDEAAR